MTYSFVFGFLANGNWVSINQQGKRLSSKKYLNLKGLQERRQLRICQLLNIDIAGPTGCLFLLFEFIAFFELMKNLSAAKDKW